jgi:hypothetical protein
MHVTIGALKFGDVIDRFSHRQLDHTRHFVGAILCLLASGLVRLAEFFIARGTGGVS